MERIEGLRIDLGLDTAAMQGGLKNLRTKLKTVNAEMKASLSAFDRADQSVEKYEATLTGLNRKMEVQQEIVKQARKEYDKMVEQYGEGSREAEYAAQSYNIQAANLNNLQRSIERTEERLQELREEAEKTSSAWYQFGQSVGNAGENLSGIGEKMSAAGDAMTTSLTLPITAFGLAAGKAALEFDQAQGRIQAQLGLTKERAAELSTVAQNVWEHGFGESVEEVTNTVSVLAQRMKDLTDDELQQMTEGALVLENAFEADLNETTRAAAQLMQQFGVSGSDAMDLITAGFQQGGNYSDEFLSSIFEYSTQFKNLGYTAEQMLGLFVKGSEEGIFSLDKLADATKESFLQITDGADNTIEAVQALGLDYELINEEIQAGGQLANVAFGQVMTALANMEDGAEKNALAIELMGTPLEDLGPQFQEFFADTDTALKDFKGASKDAGAALQDNLGARSQKVFRSFLKDLEPVGEILIDAAEDVLPKVADAVSNVTDAFNDLSPEAKKTVVVIGGIVAAAGPTISILGRLSTGLGGVLKFAAPLLPALGEGKGFLGLMKKIPGPVGAVAVGLGLAAGAVGVYKTAVKKSQEVNLEHAESLIEQKNSLQDLSGQYETLRDKNQLSNDELLRFRDITAEMQLASSADEIAKLKDEQQKLQEKSGLTNDELSTMFKLNDDIVEQAPTVDQVFSDRGQAIIGNIDSIKEVNDELREQIRLELETQRLRNEANLKRNIEDYVTALQQVGDKETELEKVRSEREKQRKVVQEAELALQDAIASKDAARITIAENELWLQQGNLNGLETEFTTRGNILVEKQEAVNKANEELIKTKEIYDQLINVQLANVGINEKGAEGVAQLDQMISKTQARITELQTAKTEQGGLNDQQQLELETLQSSLSTQIQSKEEIKRIQGEQASVNGKVEEGRKKAEGMTKELAKDVKKNVDVDDKGKAKKISDEAAKPVKKDVTLNAVWTGIKHALKVALPNYFAAGTKNAPGGMAVVGEMGPELLYLPKGSSVIPNKDTRKIFKKWGVPGLAAGGVVSKSGLYQLAEEGFSEYVIPTNPARRSEAAKLLALAARDIGQGGSVLGGSSRPNTVPNEMPKSSQPLIIQLVTPDKREFAKWMINDITELQNLTSSRLSLFERG